MTDGSNRLRVVDLPAGARARGRAHGEELRKEIAEALLRWEEVMAQRTKQLPRTYLDAFLAATDFWQAIARLTPELGEEIRGIADGAGQPLERILAYNLPDEEGWWSRDPRASALFPAETGLGCSAIGLQSDEAPVIGQNMDTPPHYIGSQVVLRVAGDPEAIVLTAAGIIGTCGTNRTGVAICVNNLWQLPNSRNGLPVACVVRGVLAKRSLSEAEGFIRQIPHASGQNYLLGDPDGLLDLECGADGVHEYEPDALRIGHTNHPLVLGGDGQPIPAQDSHSCERQEFIASVLGSLNGAESVERLLADRHAPLSQLPEDGHGAETLGSIVSTLTEPPRVVVASGPPHLGSYERIAWS